MIRGRVLLFLLGAVVVAIWFAPESKEVIEPLPRPPSEKVATAAQDVVVLAALPDLSRAPISFERSTDKILGDPQARSAAARAPKAPVLPAEFEVLGKAKLDGSWKAIVSIAGKTHIAGTGDRIDDRFTIEKVDPPALVVIDLEQAKHRFTLSIGEVR